MMTRNDIYQSTIDLLLRVEWTQKITAKHYDRLSKYNIWINWGKVGASFLSSGSVATLFAWNTWIAKIIAIVGSLGFTAIELISNKFSLNNDLAYLLNAKEKLWGISIDLTNLARKEKSSSKDEDLIDFCDKYAKLLNDVKVIQLGLPPASSGDVDAAEKEVHDEHSNNNWENENELLPPDLRNNSNGVTSDSK